MEVSSKRRECKHEVDETDMQGPGHESVQVAPSMGAGGSHPQATMDQEWVKELRDIRRMVDFVVHRERKLDVKTAVAARRLERLERERAPRQRTRSPHRPASNKPSRDQLTKVDKLVCRQGIRL